MVVVMMVLVMLVIMAKMMITMMMIEMVIHLYLPHPRRAMLMVAMTMMVTKMKMRMTTPCNLLGSPARKCNWCWRARSSPQANFRSGSHFDQDFYIFLVTFRLGFLHFFGHISIRILTFFCHILIRILSIFTISHFNCNFDFLIKTFRRLFCQWCCRTRASRRTRRSSPRWRSPSSGPTCSPSKLTDNVTESKKDFVRD